MKQIFIISLITIAAAGCSKKDTIIDTSLMFNYSIDQKVSCFCSVIPDARIFVVADTTANVISLSDGSQIPYQYWNRYKTIKGLLDFISMVDTSHYILEVEYDSLHGYPSLVAMYPKPNGPKDVLMVFYTSNYKKYK